MSSVLSVSGDLSIQSVPVVGLDVSVFDEIIQTGSVADRIKLCRELAALVADDASAPLERQQVVPSLLRLAGDPVRDVRAQLADDMKDTIHIHSDLLFFIIADEDDIALPFLAETPALDEWKMLAILRVGDEARQKTIASRPDISEKVRSDIATHRSPGAALALLDNSYVTLCTEDYRALHGRFCAHSELVERLLARPDLPLDIRIDEARAASRRMQRMMVEREWVPDNDATALVIDAEEGAILGVIEEAFEEERDQIIKYLIARDMVTASLIMRAACAGEIDISERILAQLSGYSMSRIRQMMQSKGSMAMRALHAKTGLPRSCFGLLRAAFDVDADLLQADMDVESAIFGRRLIEALMTRYDDVEPAERARLLNYVSRSGQEGVRTLARKLRTNIVKSA